MIGCNNKFSYLFVCVCVRACECVYLQRLSETTLYTVESLREIWQPNNELNDQPKWKKIFIGKGCSIIIPLSIRTHSSKTSPTETQPSTIMLLFMLIHLCLHNKPKINLKLNRSNML